MIGGTARPAGLRARGWGWRPAGRRAWAVRGLDLDVAPGERVLLLGASGAGKSTLLAAAAGLLGGPGRAGAGRVHQHDNGGESEGELLIDGAPAARARLARGAPAGLLLQDPQAQTVLARCGDDVAFGLENLAVPPDQIWPRVRQALRSVGFGYPLDHPTEQLSGGERQRLALAGVLALRPGLLLLDEPTAMLDPGGAELLRGTVRRVLAETGATCLVVEHRVADWLDVVGRVVVLEPGGGLVADGPARQVLARHGEALAGQGVWVPGRLPQVRVNRRRAGPPLLTGTDLTARPAGTGLRPSRRRGRAPDHPPPGVDIALDAGRATCLVGPNGAGKSTLAHVLSGLTAPASGRLEVGERLARGLAGPPHRWRPSELVTRIGTVFQEPRHQFLAATVRAELAVGPRAAGRREAEARPRIDELLDRLGLAGLAQANPFTLSGGEQRRLSVATALATRPSLLVLDEPTFGQDGRTWAELVRLLSELLDEGTGILAVTHDEHLVQTLDHHPVRLPGPESAPRPGAVPAGNQP